MISWQHSTSELTPQMWGVVAATTARTVLYRTLHLLYFAVVSRRAWIVDFLNWKNEILPSSALCFMLNTIINIGRSIPFYYFAPNLVPGIVSSLRPY